MRRRLTRAVRARRSRALLAILVEAFFCISAQAGCGSTATPGALGVGDGGASGPEGTMPGALDAAPGGPGAGPGQDTGAPADSGAAEGGVSADGGASSGPPDLYVTGSGVVEVFVNGTSRGKTVAAGALLSLWAPLSTGENVVVVRATSGAAPAPHVELEATGAFGKFGTSARWKAKAAVGSEATEATGPYDAPGYDDGAWASATDTTTAPTAPFPLDGPAHGIWTSSPGDAVVLLRTVIYVPPSFAADTPRGFGSAVTGGEGGALVTVTSIAELKQALCATTSGSNCSDTTPRVIQLPSQVFDFTGTEGTTAVTACYQMHCASGPSEYITNQLGACTSANESTFSVTIDAAGTAPLLVGSNKTILGIGPGATLKGKGLTLRGGVSNVVVRNVTITGINPQVVWGGDALTIDDADRVWIDHDRFSLIGRQMIVTGYGKASNLTISWNEFDGVTPYSAYCNGTHYWVMLFLGAADTITLEDNWIHDTSGRAPHAGGLRDAQVLAHMVDNDFEHVLGHAADPLTYNATTNGTTYSSSSWLLLEGNAFEQVTTPIQIDPTANGNGPGYAYAPLASTLGSTSSTCQAALGRACVANEANPMNGTFPLQTDVTTAIGPYPATSKVVPYPAAEVPHAVPHLAGPGHV